MNAPRVDRNIKFVCDVGLDGLLDEQGEIVQTEE
jgi:hypothetical protein